ncbi:tuf, partial [Symbiodinium sp. KB8]
ATSMESALDGVNLPSVPDRLKEALGALLSDPRQWRSVSAPRRLRAPGRSGEVELSSSELFFALTKITRAPVSEPFRIHGLVNHSCQPNVQRTFLAAEDAEEAPARLVLRAARPVDAGEELMDSYFFPFQPLTERRRLMAALGPKAAFQCRCPRCLAEEAKGNEDAEHASWLKLKGLVAELALLRGRRADPHPDSLSIPGVSDPLLRQPAARELVLRLEELLTVDRLGSLSWVLAAALLADLQVAVEGDFVAADRTLRALLAALESLPGQALGFEVAALRASFVLVQRQLLGEPGDSDLLAELGQWGDSVLGPGVRSGMLASLGLPPLQRFWEAPPAEPPRAAWRGDLFDDGPQGVPPLPRASQGPREPANRQMSLEGFRDGPAGPDMDFDEEPPEDRFADPRADVKDRGRSRFNKEAKRITNNLPRAPSQNYTIKKP